MRNTRKLVALILALLLLSGVPAAFASTYVSDPVSPNISGSSSGDAQPEGEATPAPETTLAPEATPAPEDTPAPEVSAEPTAAPEDEEGAVVTTEDENGSVNIRAAASMDAKIIGTLTSGMGVTVLGVEGDWTKIRTGGITGYVFSKYLKVSAPEETAAPEETVAPEETAAPEETVAPEETPAPEATPVPEDRSVKVRDNVGSEVRIGDSITLTGELTGYDGVPYTLSWQTRDTKDGAWRDIPGANGLSYTFKLIAENAKSEWRLEVTTD